MNLDQQKKLAKELLQSFAAGDAPSVARVRAVLPDKQVIALAEAQFVIARENGFANWAALKQHAESESAVPLQQRVHDAFRRCDAAAVRKLFAQYPTLRDRINEPAFDFDSPAIVAFANDRAMVDVLLDAGADPNRKSGWWAGGFHALYSATGEAAERLIAGGAIPDACALAHLARANLLARMLAENPACVHERGGDGQTPLHFAASREVIDLLLDAGADIDARDVDHRSTPAEWMLDRKRGAGRYDLARYLVERGAATDIFLAAALGLAERARAMVQADAGLLDLRTGQGTYAEQPPSSYHIYFWTVGDGLSPLDVAVQFEHPDTVDALMGLASPMHRLLAACRAADEVAARTVLREHPTLIASMTPREHRAISDAAWNGRARAVSLMLSLGFDPATPGQDTGSALHCAAWEGSVETVAVLLQHPAGRSLVSVRETHHGATPLGWCCHGSLYGNRRHDHVGVARLLLQAGAAPGPVPAEASRPVLDVLEAWRRKG